MLMERYPSPMLNVERALQIYGGWARIFRISGETYDQRFVVARESDPGFWEEYAKALADEQFREAVEEAVAAFREEYPEIRLPKRELRERLAEALVQSGWKPVKSRILKEIREIKKRKKEEIRWLKESLRKK